MAILSAPITRDRGRELSRAAATGVLLYRNYLVYRRGWIIFLTGFLEPVLYLLSIGIGVGKLVHGFDVGGRSVPYADFVAPGMLAASAMNGAIFDTTFNVFFKLKYQKLYDQVLSTPRTTSDVARGEITWALLRGGIYSAAFLLVMLALGLVHSWWAVLALPAALLIGFGFGGIGMALTTWMRSWQDFEFITLGTLPLFLFSATFFPVSAFPEWLQWVVQCTPLYRGVVLCRELTTGQVGIGSMVSVVYLLVLGVIGTRIVSRRLSVLLLT
ncbi:ABC transporter permease [Allobranchiibius huperziae]|uniref:Transport permease protein n=1 Tax=Allobranchiibius huperziae TaxID=1874116 RepID=A0A853DK46_9MICO|nr:ABC transporter permease [Allobranchiibius huperziae]NYJ75080.1 lipooligosaccharide transport system permease protein [Allobranchiibius huperziae]